MVLAFLQKKHITCQQLEPYTIRRTRRCALSPGKRRTPFGGCLSLSWLGARTCVLSLDVLFKTKVIICQPDFIQVVISEILVSLGPSFISPPPIVCLPIDINGFDLIGINVINS